MEEYQGPYTERLLAVAQEHPEQSITSLTELKQLDEQHGIGVNDPFYTSVCEAIAILQQQ
jgi:hypothetical protein